MISSPASVDLDVLAEVRSGVRQPGSPARDRAGKVAALLGALGLLYRVLLVAFDVPVANSDEGTAGLAALHIASGSDYPIFFYGQHYLGTIQSYAAAPLVWAFGPSWWALRVPPLLFYAAFVFLMYRLTRRLYSPWFAVAIVALLALGSERVIRNELMGGGGYPEMNPACALLVLLAVSLGTRAVRNRRAGLAAMAGYAAWGFVAGLVFWDHWLALPYLLVATALLLAGCWRQLRGWAAVAVVGAALIASAPLLRYNLHAAPGQDSLSVFRSISLADIPAPLADRLHGAVILGLPMSQGMCSFGVCTAWQMWWGPVYVALLVVGGYLAVRALRAAVRRAPDRGLPGTVGEEPGRVEWIRQAGRLTLIAGAALTLWAYAKSAASVHVPPESARYLHYGLISMPAVLWPLWTVAAPLWSAAGQRWQSARSLRRGSDTTPPGGAPPDGPDQSRLAIGRGVVATGVLAAVAVLMVYATSTLVAGVGFIGGYARRDRVLVAELRRLGATHIYTEYWTCDRLAYITNEQIACAVIDDKLHRGHDRYGPLRTAVDTAPQVAYVLPVGDPVDVAFEAHVRKTGQELPYSLVVGYHVYLPKQKIDVPLS